jgi:hypothetical protein
MVAVLADKRGLRGGNRDLVRTQQYDYALPGDLIVGLFAGTAGGVFFVLGLFRFLKWTWSLRDSNERSTH